MEFPQQATNATADQSPAESLISGPDEDYSSLFATTPPATSSTMNPIEMMTPRSNADDKPPSPSSPVSDDEGESEKLPSESDKKTTKKRKSWGQVLPEPKTNLPPRKRAKTEDEKEQRRVERVLRNRRAAQSSRERKRLEVEALEKRNKQLEELLNNAQKTNMMLVEELNRFRRSSGVVARSSTSLDCIHDNPITLSQELFSSQSGVNTDLDKTAPAALMSNFMTATVNPASLSPELTPMPDAENLDEEPSEDIKTSEQTSLATDLTQHPAVMLSDLPCHSSVEIHEPFLVSQTSMSLQSVLVLKFSMMFSALAMLSACQRPLVQIAMSLKAGFSLLPSPQLLTTIIWLVSIPPAPRTNQTSTSSTSTTSSTKRQAMSPPTLWQRAITPLQTSVSTSRSTTLRLKSLRKILSSSPNLARPLMDATMVALRLVSEGCEDQVEALRCEPSGTRDVDRELTQCLRRIVLPSREVLLTILWALKLEHSRIRRRSSAALDLETRISDIPIKNNSVLFRKGLKRSSRDVAGDMAMKRCRPA